MCLETGILRDKNTTLKSTRKSKKKIEDDMVSVRVTEDHKCLGVILIILKLDNRDKLKMLIRCYLHLFCSREDLYLKTVEDQEELQLLKHEYLL